MAVSCRIFLKYNGDRRRTEDGSVSIFCPVKLDVSLTWTNIKRAALVADSIKVVKYNHRVPDLFIAVVC